MGKAKPSSEPWYKDGLRFTCTGCGDCCTGAPGFVWVNKAEVLALAEHLELTQEEFEEAYVREVGIRKSLTERPNGDCVFFDGRTRKCKVYELRPRQCRSWPFWDSNMRSPEAWEETCRVCPGSGVGQLHSLEAMEEKKGMIRL